MLQFITHVHNLQLSLCLQALPDDESASFSSTGSAGTLELVHPASQQQEQQGGPSPAPDSIANTQLSSSAGHFPLASGLATDQQPGHSDGLQQDMQQPDAAAAAASMQPAGVLQQHGSNTVQQGMSILQPATQYHQSTRHGDASRGAARYLVQLAVQELGLDFHQLSRAERLSLVDPTIKALGVVLSHQDNLTMQRSGLMLLSCCDPATFGCALPGSNQAALLQVTFCHAAGFCLTARAWCCWSLCATGQH